MRSFVPAFTDPSAGGSTGIGAATVKLLAEAGAIIYIGDVNAEAADQLCKEYSGVSFVECDVTKYGDIYTLFRTAYDQHGKIDHAVSCAGIFGKHDIDSILYSPSDTEDCFRNGQLVRSEAHDRLGQN